MTSFAPREGLMVLERTPAVCASLPDGSSTDPAQPKRMTPALAAGYRAVGPGNHPDFLRLLQVKERNAS